jgi:hypothetical protein
LRTLLTLLTLPTLLTLLTLLQMVVAAVLLAPMDHHHLKLSPDNNDATWRPPRLQGVLRLATTTTTTTTTAWGTTA